MGSELLPSSGEKRNIKIFIGQHKDLKMRLITLVAFVAVIACTVAAPPQDGPKPDSTAKPKPQTVSTAKPKPQTVSTAKPKPPPVSTAKPKPVSTAKPKPSGSTAKPKPVSTAKPKSPVSTAKPNHSTTSSHSGSSKIYSFSYVTIAICVLGKYLM